MSIDFRGARHLAPIATIAASAMIAACGGSQPSRPDATAVAGPTAPYSIGQVPVYAVLRQGAGGSWLFTTLTGSNAEPESGYLVRLNDLTPAFDTRAAECAPQAYPEGHRCALSHPFRDKDSGVIDKLIDSGIAVGTAGKVTDIPSSYETTFDDAAFNRAVDEALINTGLDAGRRELLAAVERYRGLAAEARGEFSDLERRVAQTRQSVLSDYPVTIRPAVSGATDYYAGDVDFAGIVELTPVGMPEAVDTHFDLPAALPCDATSCLERTRVAIADLQARIDERRARFAAAISPDVVRYRVRCGTASFDGYLLTATCPEEIEVQRDQPAALPIDVEILSRDFEAVYPELDIADAHLGIAVDGTRVTFANPTNDYVTVTAQTIYYNSKVETSTTPIELAPGVTTSRSISEFVSPAIEVESHYRQMTPDKAANASFRFGFAARYRVAETGVEDTLYTIGTFNVGCVIANRLRPGACVEPAALETHHEDDADPEDALRRAADEQSEGLLP
jgi:hypothetical protein